MGLFSRKVSPNAKRGTTAKCRHCGKRIRSIGHGMWQLASATGTGGQLCESALLGCHKPE